MSNNPRWPQSRRAAKRFASWFLGWFGHRSCSVQALRYRSAAGFCSGISLQFKPLEVRRLIWPFLPPFEAFLIPRLSPIEVSPTCRPRPRSHAWNRVLLSRGRNNSLAQPKQDTAAPPPPFFNKLVRNFCLNLSSGFVSKTKLFHISAEFWGWVVFFFNFPSPPMIYMTLNLGVIALRSLGDIPNLRLRTILV